MGAEDMVAHLHSRLPPGQATVAMVEGLLRVIRELNRDLQDRKQDLDLHGVAIQDHRHGLKEILDHEQWAMIEGEISSLLMTNTVLVHQLESAEERLDRMEHEVKKLQRKTRVDSLTGALNRSAFDEDFPDEFSRSNRYRRPFSLLMVDIDHFKQVNDNYGHGVGDEVLRAFGRMLRRDLREVDELYRYGGEEFAILLPETGVKGATVVAERMRARVESHTLKSRDNPDLSIQITASFGVAAYNTLDTSHKDILARADTALYQAKNGGRNQVRILGAEN
jgi:diguanylate cyclase (GGDEF)-like protein